MSSEINGLGRRDNPLWLSIGDGTGIVAIRRSLPQVA